jgi:hypothetical protein
LHHVTVCGKTAVIAHGSGSTAEFVRRAFGPALRTAGYQLVTWDDRTGDVRIVADRLAALAASSSARLVGGVSLGAHAAAWVASNRDDLDGVLLALPAWTGPPAATAALSSQAADRVGRDGLRRALEELPSGWVGQELMLAWPAYGETALVDALRRTALSPAPTLGELAAVAAPVGLAAFADDAFHPLAVAQEWLRALPRAALHRLRLSDAAADRGIIGHATVDAWRQALGSTQRPHSRPGS